jgi:diacylglycerol kinase family enzyme
MQTSETPPLRRALLVANPIAGRGRGHAAADELATRLRTAGLEVDFRETGGAGDAHRWCEELGQGAGPPPFDLVVTVGGDGTLREALDGLSEADVHLPVATLPLGTANVLALDFGLSMKPTGVVETILGGRTRNLDLAEVRGVDPETGAARRMTSFLAVGVGLDAEVVERLHTARTGGISKLSYIPHVIRAVTRYRPPELKLELDGKPFDGPCGGILLANVINYGGFLKLDPATKSDDGLWELYLWRRGTRRELSMTALRGAVGHLPGGPCQRHLVRHVKVTCSSPVPYHVDGDPGGRTPFEFEVTGRRQAILIPPTT